MSSPFTTITGSGQAVTKDMMNEILRARFERESACHWGNPPEPGQPIHTESYIDSTLASDWVRDMFSYIGSFGANLWFTVTQQRIESMVDAGAWADYTIADWSGTSTSTPLGMTLARFRELAGLNDDGEDDRNGCSFRRVWVWDNIEHREIDWGAGPVNTPTLAWDYGYIQSGDIFGYWILEDLQAALSALRVAVIARRSDTDKIFKLESKYGANCANTLQNQIDEWNDPANGFRDGTGWYAPPYYVSASGSFGGSGYYFSGVRGFCNSVITELPAYISHSADVYLSVSTQPPEYNSFLEIPGMVEGEWWCWHGPTGYHPRLGSGYLGSRSTERIDTIESNPVTDAGVNCSNLGVHKGEATGARFILYWDFTNQN